MIVPLKETVLIKLKKTTLIQDSAKVGSQQQGEVLAVGDEVTYVSKGDTVIWTQYAESHIFERDGDELTLVDEKNIIAKEV